MGATVPAGQWNTYCSALASIGTAFILFKVTPAVVVIPTKAEWERVNEELKASNENLRKA